MPITTPYFSSGHRAQAHVRQSARERRDTLFLLGVFAIIVGHLALLLPPWAGIFSLCLLAWRTGLAWFYKPLPNRYLLFFLLLVGLAGSAAEAGYGSISGAALTLLVILLPLKTLEMNARRDLFVLFFLGFFGIVANFLFTQSMMVALLMILAFTGLLTALINAHKPVGQPPLRESAQTAGWLLLAGLPLITVLYIAFPRFPPLWGLPINQNTAKTGLSDSMDVGSIANLAQDQSVAMRIRFLPGSPIPQQSELYFRGPVLSRLDGNRWRSEESFTTSQEAAAGTPFNPIEPQGQAFRYEVLLEPHQQRWLLPIDATPQPPKGDYRAHMSQELVWQSYRPITSATRYTAESYANYFNARHMPAQFLQRYLQLPANSNPRTVEWAQTLRQQFGTPAPAGDSNRQLVEHVLAHLRNEAYYYTLEPGTYGQNAADEFWFERREGFCEHIASAFAILMRAAEVPARIVTGYQGGEAHPLDDDVWTVRQADAHAWVEVWLADTGWQRIDPTAAIAPERITLSRSQAITQGGQAASGRMPIGANWLWTARTMMEAVDYRWTQWVLNYNQQEQATLLERFGLSRLNWSQMLGIAATLACATAFAYLAIPWLQRRRREDPWLGMLKRAQAQLRQNGLVIADNTPPRAMAEKVRGFWGNAGEPVAQWLLEMDRVRYAGSHRTAAQTTANYQALSKRWKQLQWPPKPSTTP